MTSSREGTVRVLAAVIQDLGRYLVCRRPLHKRHGGLWEFPGGKLEPSESDLDAARRELHEELDLDVTGVGRELLAVHDPGSPFLIAFIEVTVQGTPTCHEHLELRWCTPAELVLLNLAPTDRRFAAELLGGDTPAS